MSLPKDIEITVSGLATCEHALDCAIASACLVGILGLHIEETDIVADFLATRRQAELVAILISSMGTMETEMRTYRPTSIRSGHRLECKITSSPLQVHAVEITRPSKGRRERWRR